MTAPRPHPLQNRVTPFGEIVAIAQRGLFTGNRGIIHDPATRTLLKRRWSSKAWLICTCDFQGRRRDVMATRSWTELFFLDEAIALAAGHRPCFFCRRPAAEAFRKAFAQSRNDGIPNAAQMDAILHAERLNGAQKAVHPLDCAPSELPDGAVVVDAGAAFTIVGGRGFRWTEAGYDRTAQQLTQAEGLLTPPSTLNAIRAGYRPVIHPTITQTLP